MGHNSGQVIRPGRVQHVGGVDARIGAGSLLGYWSGCIVVFCTGRASGAVVVAISAISIASLG